LNVLSGGCTQCTDTKCLTCPGAAGTCTECEPGYFVNVSNSCTACSGDCVKCTSATICEICKPNFFFDHC